MGKPWLNHYGKEVPSELTYPDHPVPQFLIDTAANPSGLHRDHLERG